MKSEKETIYDYAADTSFVEIPQILSLIFFYTPFSWRFPFQAIPSRTADGSSFLQLPMKGCIPVPL